MSDNVAAAAVERRRVTVTQLLKSPVLNPMGVEVGRVADFIAKLTDSGYPPITGLKVAVAGQDVFVGRAVIAKLEPGDVRLSTDAVDMTPFQRRPGEVLLAQDVLGRHLIDVVRGRIVQAHDLVLAMIDGDWRLLGVDRSPRAMLRRLIPRRRRPDLRHHVLVDWKDVQPFTGHVPTAKVLLPLQRLRRLHPAQIADLVEGASHEEGEEIMDAVEGDVELTADVFEELDEEHRIEFLRTRSNEEAARVLDRMAPDDAADLLNNLDQERRLPVLNLMAASQQLKLRKLLQYHPTTAGGFMSPDYVWVVRGATVDEAIEAIRIDDKAPHQLLSTVFVTEQDGRFVGSVAAVDLLRADRSRKVDELSQLVTMHVDASTDITEFTLLMSDYNLTAIAVTDHGENLIGAISVDDLIGHLIPEDWRSRVEASAGD
ncbi:MAG TPA: CBS domain-containing protein [Candidatus Dormibacteraeota bacterium]|nr:CBS domain-containing protein [Candidatus Dormibacteraeota bacterium]